MRTRRAALPQLRKLGPLARKRHVFGHVYLLPSFKVTAGSDGGA